MKRKENTMCRQEKVSLYCALAGLVLVGLGGIGFVFFDLLRFRFDPAHDLFHLVTGAVALYAVFTEKEWLGTLSALGFGMVYLLLGVGGLLSPTLWGIGETIGLQLELVENIMHLIIGGFGLYVGLAQLNLPRWSEA
jgi:uncharacterized membrane protein